MTKIDIGSSMNSYLGIFTVVDVKTVIYFKDQKGFMHVMDRYLASKIFPDLNAHLPPQESRNET